MANVDDETRGLPAKHCKHMQTNASLAVCTRHLMHLLASGCANMTKWSVHASRVYKPPILTAFHSGMPHKIFFNNNKYCVE